MFMTNRRAAAAAACVETGSKPLRGTGLSGAETVVVIIVMLIAMVLALTDVTVPVILALLGGTSIVAVGIVVSVRTNRLPRLAVQEV
ncbi:hypothetical protein GCM10009760_61460 [Kitasatospora kazusensis]|uniref:Type II secretion system protein n=1 Tax=Kitasatospora kazusensis TaxID=407974 RepID=A0ABP5M5V8_9ACTN